MTLIVGALWGDEGCGQIVDFLASRARAVVRAQVSGEVCARVKNDLGEFSLRVVPTGVFQRNVDVVVGPGALVSPELALAELAGLERRGLSTARVWLSEGAHLVMPYHVALDELDRPQADDTRASARRGVEQAAADKVWRRGLRLGDLLEPSWLRERLERGLEAPNRRLRDAGRQPFEVGALLPRCRGWAEALSERIRDTGPLVAELLRRGEGVLIEGAAGALCDVDHGAYPFVGPTPACAAGLCHGAGVAPMEVDQVLGVVRALSTLSGPGPLVSELAGEAGERLRQKLASSGSGRPRRCGWLDLVALRTSARSNGFTGLALTRLDLLDELEEIFLCRAYLVDGEERRELPKPAELGRAQPVLEPLAGWSRDTTGCRTLASLPAQARAYIDRVAGELGVTCQLVSVGPDRDSVIGG